MGINSSTYNQPGYGLTGPNDGYLYVYGNTFTGGGNLVLSTYTPKDIIFSQNGGDTPNEVARFKYGTGFVMKNLPIVFTDGTSQNTAAAPYATSNAINNYAYSAYSQANTASANTIYLQGALNSANANIGVLYGIETSQNTNIGLAWNLANTALQNTSIITLSSDLVIPGNLTVGGSSILNAISAANANISLLFNIDNYQNTAIQNAYNQANSANILAQAAYNHANSKFSSISSPQRAEYNISNSSSLLQNPNPSISPISTKNCPFLIPISFRSNCSSVEFETNTGANSSSLYFGIGSV